MAHNTDGAGVPGMVPSLASPGPPKASWRGFCHLWELRDPSHCCCPTRDTHSDIDPGQRPVKETSLRHRTETGRQLLAGPGTQPRAGAARGSSPCPPQLARSLSQWPGGRPRGCVQHTLSCVMAYRLARSPDSTRSCLILLLISTRMEPYSVEVPSGARYTCGHTGRGVGGAGTLRGPPGHALPEPGASP